VDYILGYLTIGLALTVASFARRAYVKRHPHSENGPLPELSPGSAVSVVLFITLIWPIFGTYLIFGWWQDWRRSKSSSVASPPPEFSVKSSNLVDETSIAEIERTERVHDPLGAVPDLPFGHLSGAWERFVHELQPADRIWTFVADWAPDKGVKDRYSGYAVTRDGNVVSHFTKKIVRK
jgi:hypothetical protein